MKPALIQRCLAALVCMALVPATIGQDDAIKITFEERPGWRGETIKLPPGFARDMTVKGIEEIRFAPGMFKADQEDFFSYALVFYFPNEKPLDQKRIQSELLKYYRGLAAAVGKRRDPPIETKGFKLDIKPVRKEPGKYEATLHWIEPFTTGKPQALHFELKAGRASLGGSYLATAASPQVKKHKIWPTLRKMLASVKIHSGGKTAKLATAASTQTEHWPSFRGSYASGVADGQDLPLRWDAKTGLNVRYRVPIPGLAHSSPVIWGDKLFLTTAVSQDKKASFQPGLYGSGKASEDRSVHTWNVVCIDKRTGKTLWTRTAAQGKPIDKRHIKATYANATPATDGKHVVAMFGSQGLFAYTIDGDLLWKHDLGRLDVGAYNAPQYEWGSASSPIIYRNMVIIQCDTQKQSFIRAIDLKTGKTVWNTQRDELPSWGTPTIVRGPDRDELVTNGSNYIRGYDPMTGREHWRLGGSSKITAPTPVYGDNFIVVASGRSPERPIFAIRRGAKGDITLDSGETANKFVAWSKTRRGPYMPTPLIYQGRVYTLGNSGIVACYDLQTGQEAFIERLDGTSNGFSASPVAADGRLYLPSEDGEVVVLQAGGELKTLARNNIGEPIMATPAISDNTLFIRGSQHLFAISR